MHPPGSALAPMSTRIPLFVELKQRGEGLLLGQIARCSAHDYRERKIGWDFALKVVAAARDGARLLLEVRHAKFREVLSRLDQREKAQRHALSILSVTTQFCCSAAGSCFECGPSSARLLVHCARAPGHPDVHVTRRAPLQSCFDWVFDITRSNQAPFGQRVATATVRSEVPTVVVPVG